jgi:hypothetical protein
VNNFIRMLIKELKKEFSENIGNIFIGICLGYGISLLIK